jgi:acyl-CoA synthetase (AMP-forming)/AMP-acid ligase II
VRIVDDSNDDVDSGAVGEIIVQRQSIMSGYWKKPEYTNETVEFCKQHLARYKAPRSIELVESLPKNPQGKILKKELRAKNNREK